jgi:serine/threonine protein kinase
MSNYLQNKYRISKRLGKGSFGEVYQGTDLLTQEQVAIKIEPSTSSHPQLQYESRVLRILEGTRGIPKLHFSGKDQHNIFMVIDLLGPSLEDLLNLSNRRMSLKSVLMLASQLVSIIESVHNKNYIHRDIKPQNFLMGLAPEASTVFVVDFGLAKRFRDGLTGQHISLKEGKKLTGTARFVSIFTHLGIEQSRRDDLEGLGYLFVYLLTGKLPWQDVEAENKEEKYLKILRIKQDTSVDNLCWGLPQEFAEFLRYSRGLSFEECPDYFMVREKFCELFRKEEFLNDWVYDWTRVAFRKDSLNLEDYASPRKIEQEEVKA